MPGVLAPRTGRAHFMCMYIFTSYIATLASLHAVTELSKTVFLSVSAAVFDNCDFVQRISESCGSVYFFLDFFVMLSV